MLFFYAALLTLEFTPAIFWKEMQDLQMSIEMRPKVRTPRTKLLRPQTVAEFQKMFDHIYRRKNNKLYSNTALMYRLAEEILSALELARKDYRTQFKTQLPNVFSWSCAFANRLRINLHEALWKKFPGVCSYCSRDIDCVCGTEHPSIPDKETVLRRLRRDREGREPKTLRDHQELHARLYKWQNARILPIQVVAHLAEEAGEVMKEFRHGKLHEVQMEMADVASWIFAIATRLELDPIDELVWRQYPYECSRCHKDRCVCKDVI
ncbi:MAG: MazG nucleotide pyrophosphohydrolase domain-containing protein [bacterium]|nr:MazG nucleotide pyrophosphohydrolase domain-containing protein [bacterium]